MISNTIKFLNVFLTTLPLLRDASSLDLQTAIAERALLQRNEAEDNAENRRVLIRERIRTPKLMPANGRVGKAENTTMNCDAAFFQCLGNRGCNDCFIELKTKDIDWAGVTENTECSTVMETLHKNGLCTTVIPGAAQDIFCQTFHTCVYFEDYDTDDDADDDFDIATDCDSLTECDWPGIHKSFVGDGVCHDSFQSSCYNTAVCNWDGGDCCKDTCKTPEDAYLECGTDGYACRDPKSTECDPTLTLKCPPDSYKKTADDHGNPANVKCATDESMYRVVMYDSFGDGWEGTNLTISEQGVNNVKKEIWKGGLKTGAEGTAYLCLSTKPTCYYAEANGGLWGRESSWLVRGYSEGAPAIASGGAPMRCSFPIAGGTCENTCTGRQDVDPSQDSNYKDFKQMFHCVEDKCVIQSDECKRDSTCVKCFEDNVPEYCYSIDTFKAVTDCSMCKCSGMDNSDYCTQKLAPGAIIPTPTNGGNQVKPTPCSPGETAAGGNAVLEFGKCMDYDRTSMIMNNFDQNNFGDLDIFEACAHSFNDRADHGGHTALGCLRILKNAIEEEAKPGEPAAAIAQLAELLYHNGESFCDCAKKASDEAPLCPAFYNFKTLLYESLDACLALDEIDCDAWDEFQQPCKTNLLERYKSIDLTKKEQCDYIKDENCGAGPFPSFRRLDCAAELPTESWDFYNDFSRLCIGDEPVPPIPAPVAPPIAAPVAPPIPKKVTKPPTPYQPIKPSNIQPTPYHAPTEDKSNKKPTYRSPDEKKSHWFRNLVLICVAAGIGYSIYKRQSDGFSFVRYRRLRNFGFGHNMDDGDMYSGLALESSTNFEPPSLPPTPSSMPNNGGYGA